MNVRSLFAAAALGSLWACAQPAQPTQFAQPALEDAAPTTMAAAPSAASASNSASAAVEIPPYTPDPKLVPAAMAELIAATDRSPHDRALDCRRTSPISTPCCWCCSTTTPCG
jgi:hypothetical protein